MNKTARRIMVMLSVCGVLAAQFVSAQEASKHVLRDAVTGTIKPAKIAVRPASNATAMTKRMPFFSSGPLMAVAAAMRVGQDRGEEAFGDEGPNAAGSGGGQVRNTIGCSNRTSNGNVRVNQDCTYRRQAEEKIVYNPANPNNLIAGQNDSRVGFNQCGIDWSVDDGRHWGDLLPPFRQRLNDPASELATSDDPNDHTIVGGAGTAHTYDASSDPAPAFDSQGRGFFACVAFDVSTNANLVYTMQSPAAAQGSFFYNIESAGRNFIVDEENDPRAALDKPFITADSFAQSPNRDNVYATWTVLNFTCAPNGNSYCSGTIFGSMSTNHGLTWSTPEEISGSSPLCFFGNAFDPKRSPSSCDFDQGSEPAPQPSGDLVVIFNNLNTPPNDPNAQQLGVVCHPSGSSPDGTARLNCGSPVKVGDDIVVGEPLCDFGRGPEECIPGAFIRTDDFPRLAVNPVNGDLFATWQDYRSKEFDIQLSSSTDGGRTWTASVTVNPDSGLDHYFPADAVAPSHRDRVGVSYYRTQRVPNENTSKTGVFALGEPGVQRGSSDYVLARGKGSKTPFSFKVVSPAFAAPDGNQAGFNGDYSGLVINKEDEAHPLWSDTRNVNPFPLNGVVHDEDVFTDTIAFPDEP
ncbi:MAG: hypothetical protein JWN85_1926 [Gammaproteobacteria bacterium]|nr:hypothetical protein [Gammaproteobacteria bacterium]